MTGHFDFAGFHVHHAAGINASKGSNSCLAHGCAKSRAANDSRCPPFC
eukprot:CAMPEP_0172726554 /NCGR_PEP_ID=MMETSP1074-20121228/91013_1 /TAXON_ID=2916 /ORGANISM="Ceratium fusus, Strain PA161109" /LENGTH=47 /DNA_ID= /DNA_START= /DNA_END= /DNA_ORIENTATION=